MTIYLSNRDGDGKTNEEGHYKFQTSVFAGNVLGADSLKVTQNSPIGMSVLVSSGQYKIDTSAGYSYTGWLSSDESVNINTADPANPRISTIVLYVDKNETTSPTPPNNPGVTKLISVDGTPSAVPTAPNNTVIQSAVGAGNPYIVLANVRVNAGVTSILNLLITDTRTQVTIGSSLVDENSLIDGSVSAGKLADSAVTTSKLANLSVTTPKIADGAVTDDKWRNGIAFYARRVAARSIAAATFTNLAADSIQYNLGGAYSNASSNGRFTAPVAGVYLFFTNLNASAVANTRAIIEIRVNGSTTYARQMDIAATRVYTTNATTFAKLNPGDYVETFVWTQVATNVASSGVSTSEFGGFLITRT